MKYNLSQVGVQSDFNDFKKCWENGLEEGKFVRRGGHLFVGTLYLD